MPLSQIPAAGLSSGVPTRAQLPAGSVLQVISSLNQAGATSTSTTYIDITSATVTITPTASTSKILIISSGQGSYGLVSGVNIAASVQLLRTSTALQEITAQVASASGGLQQISPFSFSYLDAPATTSATTYKLQQKISTASSTLSTSSFWVIAMEIAA